MTDRRSTADPRDDQDAELERRLRAGFAAAPAPAAPESIHAEAARLGSGSKVPYRPSARGLRSYALLAVALGSLVVIGSLLSIGSGPSPSPAPIAPGSASSSVTSTTTSPSVAIAPTPTPSPSPRPELTPWPAVSMAPAADDVLPLAGRDGLPGWLYCGGHPFEFAGLAAPTGAEDRIGPEFDVLRETVAKDGGNFWGEGGPDPTFREAGRDASGVVFLYDRVGVDTTDGGPYIYIELGFDGTRWHWEQEGDCLPRALPPLGFGPATWTLDPAFPDPDADTRTLHLLVAERACSSGRSATGRISPAFVTWDPHQVVMEVFVEALTGGQDCQGTPPTPATVRLPIPLGDRTLFDAGTIGLGGSGG